MKLTKRVLKVGSREYRILSLYKTIEDTIWRDENTGKNQLEIIHSAICGPRELEMWNGNKYAMTALDFTNFVMIYFMQSYTEALQRLFNYVAAARAKWNNA
ncbi:hypothetical protein WN48_00012 [Eufriesea mexicana]|uniref:Uncharacterized protein n=1 Tax=Eufriesea mexicana TaxID=516756 RepID=A0A310STL9_9HYME|nr:hypothetical protein WN48_00012 [Eufriesea mexicana]